MEIIWPKHKKINTTLKPKVFVAMSGGVDSSVAAALLKEQEYEVTGVFMKNWSDSRFFKDKTMCPWVEDQESARQAAAVLDIQFYTFDFEKEYWEKVVEYMVENYKAGITPNPDAMCNKEIKFGVFLEKALEMGSDFIATGHYARICEIKSQKSKVKSYELLSAIDLNKNQSYFLWTLTQEQLKHCLFPIGDYEKPQVRELARKFGLPNAERKDSQGLCFVGDIDFFDFLKSQIAPKKGKIMTLSGKEVGEHEGVQFFTIGQRHGIGVKGGRPKGESRPEGAGGIPYYVAGKDIEKNILYVAEGIDDRNLYKKELIVGQANWTSGEEPELPLSCRARIRYRQPLQDCVISKLKAESPDKVEDSRRSRNYKLKAVFCEPQRAVTPGQSVVFYDGDIVLGGGIIIPYYTIVQ